MSTGGAPTDPDLENVENTHHGGPDDAGRA